MELVLDKKQIWVIFLFEFKMGCKAVEKTRNIDNAFGPGTANEHTVQWWYKKFYEKYKRFEDEQCGGWPLEVDNNQLWADPLTTTQGVAEELNINHSMVIQHLKQKTEKVKNLSKWVPHEWSTNQKKSSFWS